MEREGRIIAHAGVWPVTVVTDGTRERGTHMMDWVSDPEHPGSGITLLQRISRNYDFVYSVGGSEHTLSILPAFGFRQIAEALTWARPIRPWRQIAKSPKLNWRTPLRLARNLWWSNTPSRSVSSRWTAVQTSAEEPYESSGERSEPFFRYLGQCPQLKCLTYRVMDGESRAGHFALAIAKYQARLAGVWLTDPSTENWKITFHLALKAALEDTGASELVARCATPASVAAAEWAGLRVRKRSPVLLFRKVRSLGPPPLQYQLADNDAVFFGPALRSL
jgi:hypothetical protein